MPQIMSALKCAPPFNSFFHIRLRFFFLSFHFSFLSFRSLSFCPLRFLLFPFLFTFSEASPNRYQATCILSRFAFQEGLPPLSHFPFPTFSFFTCFPLHSLFHYSRRESHCHNMSMKFILKKISFQVILVRPLVP